MVQRKRLVARDYLALLVWLGLASGAPMAAQTEGAALQGPTERGAPDLVEAVTLQRAGRFDEAYARLLALHRAHPDAAEVMTRLGYLERERGLMDESIRWFRRAAATGQNWYDFVRLAVSYTDLGDLDGTRWATERLDEAAPIEGAGTGLWLLFSERWDEYAAFAQERLDRGGDPSFWRELAAYGAVMTGRYERALELFRGEHPELFEETPRLAPGRPTSPLWIAYALQRTGKPARAEALIRLVLDATHPRSGEFDRVYAKTYRMVAHALLGRDREAVSELRSAIDQGLHVRLFDNVVLFEKLPLLAHLHADPEFAAMMEEMRTDNARLSESLRRPRGSVPPAAAAPIGAGGIPQ